MLEEWTAALCAELGVDLPVDSAMVLDLAKDAAHVASRPAAPITAFLVGYAAARSGGTTADVTSAMDTARLLAAQWAAEPDYP